MPVVDNWRASLTNLTWFAQVVLEINVINAKNNDYGNFDRLSMGIKLIQTPNYLQTIWDCLRGIWRTIRLNRTSPPSHVNIIHCIHCRFSLRFCCNLRLYLHNACSRLPKSGLLWRFVRIYSRTRTRYPFFLRLHLVGGILLIPTYSDIFLTGSNTSKTIFSELYRRNVFL